MSSNKTEHLSLHAWEPEDMFTREEFNANFAAIDGEAGALRAAVAAAQAAADAAQKAADAAQGAADTAQGAAEAAQGAAEAAQSTADGRLRIQLGTYIGAGKATSSTSRITLNFDFRPQLVLLFSKANGTANSLYQFNSSGATSESVIMFKRDITRIVTRYNNSSYFYNVYCSWGERSLSFYANSSDYSVDSFDSYNYKDSVYHWIAIG